MNIQKTKEGKGDFILGTVVLFTIAVISAVTISGITSGLWQGVTLLVAVLVASVNVNWIAGGITKMIEGTQENS